ncbi:MAG: hypothetical protein K6U04_15740 [Armatimonadetes bacterium]|nr:hypothetical protein [Armatimonadota bacterium]
MQLNDELTKEIEKLSKELLKDEKKKSQADILFEIADTATLFHDQFNRPMAAFTINNHSEIWPVRSKFFKNWLAMAFYREQGKTPNNESLTQALNVVEAKAIFDGECYPLNLRVAEKDGAVWYDLANENWQAIKITPDGWQVVDNPPILFRRHSHMAPQVMPERGGNMEKLLDFMNVRDDDAKILMRVFPVVCLIPNIPHVVPNFYGEKGAAKSTISRVLRRLIDPSATETLTIPHALPEVVQVLSHHYFAAFDNVDGLQGWQSDLFCQVITGSGFSKRMLFSDDDDVVYNFQHCISLNGINVAATRPDLLDRSILIELERIPPEKRREEKKFWDAFEKARPGIFGAMLDALAGAMKTYPTVRLDSLPRMADFCKWGYAVAEAIGIGGERFLAAYWKNISIQNEAAISGHPVAAAVVAFMQEKGKWEGTAAELLASLEKAAEAERINIKSKTWPRAAHSLTRRLKEIRSNLLDVGIELTIERDDNNKSKVSLRRVSENSSESSGAPEPQENQGTEGRSYSGAFELEKNSSRKAPAPDAYGDGSSGATGATGAFFGNSPERNGRCFREVDPDELPF